MASILHALQNAVKDHLMSYNWPIDILALNNPHDIPPIYRTTIMIEPLIPEGPDSYLPTVYFDRVKLKVRIISPKYILKPMMTPMELAEQLCNALHGFDPKTTGAIGHFMLTQPSGWSTEMPSKKSVNEVYRLQFSLPVYF